jgi:hypothetical protein
MGLKPYTIILLVLFISIVSRIQSQNIKPDSGLFYYSDSYDTYEIEFFPGNTLCVIQTTYDIAMFQAACGTYDWKGDTLILDIDFDEFLKTHLLIDTLSCTYGEVSIRLKTIAPYSQPEWRNSITWYTDIYPLKNMDSLSLITATSWGAIDKKFEWSKITAFDTLYLDVDRIIEGPSIPIPDASCMHVEYPFLWQDIIDHPSEHTKYVFSSIKNNRATITIIENNFKITRDYQYIKRDPFDQ